MGKKLLIFAGVIVSSLLIGVGLASPTAAVDAITITSFDVQMELGRDDEDRSTLRTVETITADFTQRDENHGLERTFAKTYDSHPTSFALQSVTDETGRELPYSWNGNTLQIGDEDTYVYGQQTYTITYTQRDVTRYYVDTAQDEFYWDAIGVEWRVPIEHASVALTVAPEIQAAVQTDLQCYMGVRGSTDTCVVRERDGAYTTQVWDVGEGSGVTIALGFAPDTFMPYEKSLWDQFVSIWLVVTIATTILGAAGIVWLLVRARKLRYRDRELGTIAPEYIPPKNISVAASAAVLPGYHSTLAAQLTDLAVRHHIQILETKPKRSFFRPAEYSIKLVRDIAELRTEEQEILKDMFLRTPQIGDELALRSLQNSPLTYTRFRDNDKKLRNLVREQYKFMRIDEQHRGWFGTAAKVLLVLAVMTLSPVFLLACLVAFVLSKSLWVLSDEGLSLRRYLQGLKMYIQVAEKDRLQLLQSPDGAQKVGVGDPSDPAQLVKLYEEVLPYAIVFRQEKQWSKQLGEYYASAGSSPSWYSGASTFNAATFSSVMTNFSGAVGATSASSSSGGSGGGGSSGGGGGGGGGGGW